MSNGNDLPIYKDTTRPAKERAADLVSRMTTQEKVQQMLHDAPAIERLAVASYNWWNECLHGVGRAGVATVFPQAIGLAATWDLGLFADMTRVISDEARAKYNESQRRGDHTIYRGLTFWSPNINIFRDPRWGRGHETYGEDPYLTGRLGVAFVKGLQGDDPKYMKAAACAKHYAVHSGPEKDRHHFDAIVDQKDLWETYLPAFRELVQEAKVEAVMGAYNRVNGEPSCASKTLLSDILRDKWGFDGHVVSDCGAIADIHQHHKVTQCTAESAAISVKNGCDLECGCVYASLTTAIERGLIAEEDLDRSLVRLFTTRMRLGMFDPEEAVPFSSIPWEVNDAPEHRAIALEAAHKSIVLLKNVGNTLPIAKNIKTLGVIGPNATHVRVLLGNYNGTPSKYVTILDGLREKCEANGVKLLYSEGSTLTGLWSGEYYSEAVSVAQISDAVVMVLGITPDIEGEEGDAFNSDAGGDRVKIDLPEVQQRLLEIVHEVGKPVILVNVSGSAMSIPWADEHVPAILQVFYPGQDGGLAVADVIFGDYNPAGRMPVTVVRSIEELPPFEDYSMKGRTYRYFEGSPLYPFGFGLSYTRFAYSDIELTSEEDAGVTVSATVKNTGERTGDEVVEVYLKYLEEAGMPVPIRKLVGFTRVNLAQGEEKRVSFEVKPEQIATVCEDGESRLLPGKYRISVAGSQADTRSIELGAAQGVTAGFELG